MRRLVEAVVGAADPLEQARAALGRAHLDDEVDVAPVDAEVEAGGATSARSLPARHRRLDLAPRLEREAAVVDADRQRLVVDRPQVLEDQLGEAARVAEDERRLVLLDQLHHLARGVAARMAGPRDAVFGDQDREVGLGAGIAVDQVDRVDVGVGREPAAIGVGVGDRSRDRPTRRRLGRERLQPRRATGEQVAALLVGEGVDLVDDDGPEVGEQQRAVGVAEQQAQRFGRGQQDMRRPHALARLAVRRRVAGAGLDPDRRPISSIGASRLRWTSTASAFSGET